MSLAAQADVAQHLHRPESDDDPVSVLVCTLGTSWAVVPEVYGWLAPGVIDLFRAHPRKRELDRARSAARLDAPSEIWVVTSDDAHSRDAANKLLEWRTAIDAPLKLRIWRASGTRGLESPAECATLRELVFRAVLHATERARGTGKVVLSLSGGRKTMSADLQEAGELMGAHAWVHVVATDSLPARMRDPSPGMLAAPLSAELVGHLSPVLVAQGRVSELLDIEVDGVRVRGSAFPLPMPDPDGMLVWQQPAGARLVSDELASRQRQSHALLSGYLKRLDERGAYENWPSLYRLPPRRLDALRTTTLAPSHRRLLELIPKVDLHRHLGGCLALDAQIDVAHSIWNSVTDHQRSAAMSGAATRGLGPTGSWPDNWPDRLRSGVAPAERAAMACAILVNTNERILRAELWDATEPRVALRDSARGFRAYEIPGELSGSALLALPQSMLPYARAVVDQARREGLRYVELRGSPQKYRRDDPAGFVAEFEKALRAAGAQTRENGVSSDLRIAFVWILDRRDVSTIEETVASAVRAHEALDGFMVGIDVAGDESVMRPELLAEGFRPAFAACLPITIHAGEGEPAENIWQAAYNLHADRIGHGLTIADRPDLARRFRDRRIALEICPTSNREVVGYRDELVPGTGSLPTYPLRRLIELGVPLTICTDNPGISRTTLADEYLAASRMCDGLSLWETLALIRQGFTHAFVPAAERDRTRMEVDNRIYRILSTDDALRA
ncbi:MAG: hypothetical protein KJZ83_06500 [Burkholderiaceae bacterium]|nr:hypothetical protein [Burkholderiaceae bacterium]